MVHRFDDYEIDVPRREIRRNGVPVAVEPMVFDVIAYLASAHDRVVTKTELLDEVWGDRFVSESTLTSRIKAARRALGDDGNRQEVIRTVHGRGYRFVADVGSEPAPEPPPPAVDASAPGLDLEIRFVEGRGGVTLAVGSTGTGPPLVKTATWMTQVDKDTDQSPIWGHWVRALSRNHRYVRYDPRGCGLSDRDLRGIPLDDVDLWVEDLERVLDDLGIERAALLGLSQGGPVATVFAARHPDRVSHLILCGTYARGMRMRDDETEESRAGLIANLARYAWSADSSIYREVFARSFVPDASRAEVDWFNDQLRATTNGDNAVQLEAAFHRLDVSELARTVAVPTLVFHAEGDACVPFEEGRRLAGLIPGARFVPLPGANHIFTASEPAFAEFVAEIERFTAE